MPTQQEQLMQQLVVLTEAVKELAARPTHPPIEQPGRPPVVIDVDIDEPGSVTDADRVRQRVAFSYQALGTLTGRVSTATGREFDVPVVRAVRGDDAILFEDLPPGAHWVELRTGGKVEQLRIRRIADGHDGDSRRSDAGEVFPTLFAPSEPIGSTVFLRTARGPLIAFGPRLAAFGSDEPVESIESIESVEPAEPTVT
jgi:hypothetical protein